MKDTLTYLVTAIVDHPEDVVIDERQVEDMTVFTLHVNPEDMGKIIGKGGRIIRSIRDLIKILAAKKNLYVDVEIAEDQRNAEPASPAGGSTNA